MTEKQKEFLLADISARLPYGVKCAEIYPDGNKFENVWDIIRVSKYVEDGIHISNCKTIYGYCSQIQNIKPYLFPLDSITIEQERELSKLGVSYCEYALHDDIRGLGIMVDEAYIFFEFCYKHHIDFLGLIDMGLAIDATGKNIY